MPIRSWLLAFVALLLLASPSDAQLLARIIPANTARKTLRGGSVVYSSQCNQCHGRDGDQVSGIDLRRGVSSGARSPTRISRASSPAARRPGMPPFRCSPRELAGIVAYHSRRLRHHARSQGGQTRRAGATIFDGKGQCARAIASPAAARVLAPDLSDVGLARAPAALERSIRESVLGDAADQPAGANRDEGRTDHSRAAGSTRTPTACRSSTSRNGCVSIAKSDVRTLDVETISPMPALRRPLDRRRDRRRGGVSADAEEAVTLEHGTSRP